IQCPTPERVALIDPRSDDDPMTNDEAPMTKECPNDEARRRSSSSLGFRHSFVIRISSFVIFPLLFCATLHAASVTPTTSGPIGDPEKAGLELVRKLREMAPP